VRPICWVTIAWRSCISVLPATRESETDLVRASLAKPEAPRLAHRVYVIELDPAVLRDLRFRARNPNHVEGMPCVYVGMTGLSVEERFANHLQGYKSNRYAHKYGVRLLPELYACFNPMPYEAARQMEMDLADELQEKGYGVWQG
jgi:hypothetical protein